VASQLELIIIGPAPPVADEFNLSGFQVVRWVPWPKVSMNLHRARAIGVEISQSAMVTFAENHAFPKPGWAAALIKAQQRGWDAIGPVMDNANPASAVSRAHLMLAHGPWTVPQKSGPRRSLPWHNSAYKTKLLRRFGYQLPRFLAAEGLLQSKLHRDGARFYLTADAVVDHLNISRIQPFFVEQLLAGRLFGAHRASHWSAIRRIGYTLATGLIPGLRLLRLKKRFPHLPGLLTVPLLVGVTAHTIGEAFGYWLGAGSAIRRSSVYELTRDKFVRASDLKEIEMRYPSFRGSHSSVQQVPTEATHAKYLSDFPESWKDILKRQLLRLPLPLPPLRLQVDVTDNCNFSCPDCMKWRTQNRGQELSAAQYQILWSKLKNLILFKEVTFSGGEPLLRKDLPELITGAKQSGFHTTVATNGWHMDIWQLKRLNQAGLDRTLLSLNSLKESIHDDSKGMPGSYERVRSAIQLWERPQDCPDLVLSCLITPGNVAELSALVAFTHKNKASILFQAYCEPAAHYPFSDRESIPKQSVPGRSLPWTPYSLVTLNRAVKQLLKLKAQGAPIRNTAAQLRRIRAFCHHPYVENDTQCAGPFFRLFCDPAGNLRLCQGSVPIGNILVDSPVSVWWGRKARQLRRSLRTCDFSCRMLNNHY